MQSSLLTAVLSGDDQVHEWQLQSIGTLMDSKQCRRTPRLLVAGKRRDCSIRNGFRID
jgi:hypothetical protein